MWFEIKQQSQIIYGLKNFFILVHCIQQFPTAKFALLCLKLCKEMLFFAHPENVLLVMLGDDDEEIRRLAINKIQALQGKSLQHTIPNGNFKGGYIKDYRNMEGAVNVSSIRVFEVSIINVNV